jgi:predicted nuclease of predicted toxin-antitoxin system
MRWLVDECVDAPLVHQLRAGGHDILYMAEVAPCAGDEYVLARADQEQRLLLTEDKDFGDLVFRQAKSVPGIVPLRIDSSRRASKVSRLQAAIEKFGTTMFGRYTVVEEVRFRSRLLRAFPR